MATKRKKMTAREKQRRADAREQLRAQGLIPPKKKPLNRAKFIEQAKADFFTIEDPLRLGLYLYEAFGWVYAARRGTLEAVGAAKVMAIAAELYKIQREFGSTMKYEDQYERLKPIFDA